MHVKPDADKSLHGLMVSGPCDDACSHSVEELERNQMEGKRVTGGGKERQQKSVNPSIRSLLQFWRSQTVRDYAGHSLAPPSCCFVPPRLVQGMEGL